MERMDLLTYPSRVSGERSRLDACAVDARLAFLLRRVTALSVASAALAALAIAAARCLRPSRTRAANSSCTSSPKIAGGTSRKAESIRTHPAGTVALGVYAACRAGPRAASGEP